MRITMSNIHSLNNGNHVAQLNQQQAATPTGNQITSITGNMQQSQTAGGGILQGNSGYPYYGYYNTIIQPTVTTTAEMKIRKVKNGWIILHNNEEYVLTESQQVHDYLDLLK
jgi:hypothetical protein